MKSLAREYVENVYAARDLGYTREEMKAYLRTLDDWLRAATSGHVAFCEALSDAYQIIEEGEQ